MQDLEWYLADLKYTGKNTIETVEKSLTDMFIRLVRIYPCLNVSMRLKSYINSCWYQHNNSIGPINNNVGGNSHHSLLINHEICDPMSLNNNYLLHLNFYSRIMKYIRNF